MAMNQLFNNVKQQAITATDKIKDGITETASKTGLYDANKQKIKPLIAEKAKMYEFIGMEIFDLYAAGEIDLPIIEPFCKKLLSINAELAQLENTGEPDGLYCECGLKLHEEMKFCMACGKRIEKSGQTVEEPVVTYTKCVCGETVEVGTPMCMECGRRIFI